MDPATLAPLVGEVAALATLVWLVRHIFTVTLPTENKAWREELALWRSELAQQRETDTREARERIEAYYALNGKIEHLADKVDDCPHKEPDE